MPDVAALIPPDALIAAHGAARTYIETSALDIDTLLYRITGPATLMLLGIICYFLRRLVNTLDRVEREQAEMKTDKEVEKEKLKTHMADDFIHCKGLRCSREIQGG